MHASPSQLDDRTKISKRGSFSTPCPRGMVTPRLYRESKKSGFGVFQRLWTQNQSFGERRIPSSNTWFIRAVASSTPSSPRPPPRASPHTRRHRAAPTVSTHSGTTGAPVRRLNSAAKFVVDAKRPKKGHHTPPSPACWSTNIPSACPDRSHPAGAENPSRRSNSRHPDRLRRRSTCASKNGFASD